MNDDSIPLPLRQTMSATVRRIWLWAVSGGLLLFRTASITGGVIVLLEYVQLAALSMEMTSDPLPKDWNMIGTGVEVKSKESNVTLPLQVLCADGRTVSSCHECAATNTQASCRSNDCQWCPYGALLDKSSIMEELLRADRGVALYDASGEVRKVHDAHVPIGAQCVSTLQTCRPPSTTIWLQEVELLEQSPALAQATEKAAHFTTAKPCRSRGYQFCPYGALYAYHNFTQKLYRPAQCIPKRLHCQPADDLLVQPRDVLYRQRYGSAVVIPQFKLVFVPIPKVACTVWYQLFRRIMGYQDWQSDFGPLPHDPNANGLLYLADLTRSEATDIWMSPAWTKAIFVRDPKERLLSAYLDKVVVQPRGSNRRTLVKDICCRGAPDCGAALDTQKNVSLSGFINLLVERSCFESGDHWNLQSQRIEAKFWPYINFVGHFETAAADAQTLLERVGAWETYGATGWGSQGNLSMFESVNARHITGASTKVRQYFDSSTLESKIESLYQADYNATLLGLSKTSFSSNT